MQELEPEELLQVKVEKKGKELLARFWCEAGGKRLELTFQLDTPASCNVLSLPDYVQLGSPKLRDSEILLSMYDGSVKRSLGQCLVVVKDREGKSRQLVFEVLKTRHHTLLSLDTYLQLELISYRSERVNLVSSNSILTRETVLLEFGDVFSGVGYLPGEYHIDLDPALPPMLNRPRPRKIPHTMRAAVEDKLRVLEENGIIATMDQPTEWISNITTVWKHDKKSVRVCLDPRDLNKAIRRNHFYLPTVDDVLPQLKGARVFSLLDAKDGFLQVKLSESSSFLTTFWGAGRKYRWLRMPFGISSSPEEFQCRLQDALHGLEGVAVVADDTLVYGMGKTDATARQDHDQKLLKLLQRAREVNLKFNKDKMRLHQTELLYIGHQISAQGVKPDTAKVTAVKNMPIPKTVQDVRRFLGMANYLSRSIPNLSQVAEPLRHLTERDAWGTLEQAAFEAMKTLISNDQLHVLAFYDVHKPIVIQCDASTEGLGATLLQDGRPVASVSLSLKKSEKKYVALEL